LVSLTCDAASSVMVFSSRVTRVLSVSAIRFSPAVGYRLLSEVSSIRCLCQASFRQIRPPYLPHPAFAPMDETRGRHGGLKNR
jgi:hypothetical protein